jgi:hypothetical protein
VLTEFGEVYEDANFVSAHVGTDHSYVPGYSDLRKQRDMDMAAVQRGEKKLKDVASLPVRLQWTRAMRVSGNEPDNTKEIQAGNDGYRTVTKADIGQVWLKELPPGAKIVAGGAIRKGDVTLMVCDAPRAAKNAAQAQIQTMREVQDLSKRPLMAKENKGAAPYIESTLGTKPIGQ